MLLQNIALCVPDVHKPTSLPGAANCGVRSWPRLPGILQDNLLTSNGLSSFCLSPCGNQRVFLSIPLPSPSSSPSEMLKHLVASKQGQTTNTWMSIFFFFIPRFPEICSYMTAGSWRLWVAPSCGGCHPIRNSPWHPPRDWEGPYSGADPITSRWNDAGPRHQGMMSWALTCHQKKYKLPGAVTLLQGDICSPVSWFNGR